MNQHNTSNSPEEEMPTTSASSSDEPPRIPDAVKFLYGGLSGIGATLVVHPLDLVKNRMQLSMKVAGQKASSFQALRSVIANEGPLAVYNGLSAGLLRQVTYTATRLGIYTYLFEKYSSPNKSPNFLTKLAIGSVAGGAGSFVGTPTDVVLVRMTSDGRLPLAERRSYTSVFNALFRIGKEEGLLTLWKGLTPTVARAMVLNASQLAVYSQAKEAIHSTGYVRDGILCHFCASMMSGLVATATSLPLDAAKTRIQNMRVVDGRPEYRGVIDVLCKIVKQHGLYSLWRGFTPYYTRIGPSTILTFIILEQLNRFYFRYVLGVQGDRPGGL